MSSYFLALVKVAIYKEDKNMSIIGICTFGNWEYL